MISDVAEGRFAKSGLAIALIVFSALIFLCRQYEQLEGVTRILVSLVSIGAVFTGFWYPRLVGWLFVYLYLVASYDPSVRNLFTVLGGVLAAGLVAHSGRLLLAILFGAILSYIAATDIFRGEFFPVALDSSTIFVLLYFGSIVTGWYVKVIKRRNAEERKKAEEEKRRERDALVKMLHDSVAGTLTSSVMRAEGVCFSPEVPDVEKAALALIADENRKAIEQVRELIRALSEDSVEESVTAVSLTEQVNYMVNLLESHDFTVSVQRDEALSQRIYGRDLNSLPIMNELASNVIKYGVPGSEVLVEMTANEGGVLVTVSNRIANGRSASYLSSGLGLGQIHKLVTDKGGEFFSFSRGDFWVSSWLIPGK